MKYRVGDKVRIRSWESMAKEFGYDAWGDIKIRHGFTEPMKKYCGKIVTIAKSPFSNSYYIEEDEHRWVFVDEMFEPVSYTIIIYRKDNEVIALDKTTGKMNKAICSPEDTFDFYTGASLAITRLINDEPVPVSKKVKKYYNGEIVCVSAQASNLTRGKIYKVKNGQFRDDHGNIHGCTYPYINFNDLNSQHISEFVEVVR